MSEESPGTLARALGRFVAWITNSKRNSALVVAVALLLASVAAIYGSNIRVNTDLRALLPKTAPSVVALDELEARSGGSETFIVAIEASTPEHADAMAKGIAEEIASWPETEQLSIVRDYTAIRDHALYFIELEQLEKLRDELDAQRKRAVARAMGPGLTGDGEVDIEAVSADDWDDPDADDLDWDAPPEQPSEPEPQPEPEPEPEPEKEFDLDQFLDEQRNRLIEESGLDEDEIAVIWPDENERGEIEWQEQVGRPYQNDDGTVRTVQAVLSRPATDVEFAQDVVGRVQRRADSLRDGQVAADTRAEVVAAYDVSAEVDTIVRDARRATWISITTVLAVLIIGFRTFRSVALTVVPMSVSMALTLAIAKLLVGELNTLTAFLFAVLFGMGIDFSVHLYALREHQGRVADWPKVVRDHFRPLMATMLTTSGALAVLALAEFKAFREFGVISSIGVAVCLLAAFILVPATDTLLGPLRGVPAAAKAVRPKPALAARTIKLLQGLRYVLLAGVAIFAIWGAPKLEMEKDTRAFKAKRPADQDKIAYASTNNRCAKSLALVAETPEDLDLAVERLRAEQGQLLPGAIDTGEPRKPWVREVYSLRTLMPTDQAAKAAVIAEVGVHTNDFLAELPDLDDEARRHQTHLEALERLTKFAPLTTTDLPDWSVDPFRERDDTSDRIAHACLDIAGYHIDELVAVRHRLDELFHGLDVRAADSRLVFADLMVLIERDARRLPIIALVVILGLIAVDLRRVWPTLVCFFTLVLGLALVLAVMGVWPLRLNFFNLVVMPAVIGLGIDASIHLWHGRERTSLSATGKATVLAALTTVAGFLGPLAAEHAGLRSIGEVGILAIIACVAVAFLALYPIPRSGRS